MKSSPILDCTSPWEVPSKLHRACKAQPDFSTHKNTIFKLYIVEDLQLDQVRRIMTRRHRFHASEIQYKRQLRDWKMKKRCKSSSVTGTKAPRSPSLTSSPTLSPMSLDSSAPFTPPSSPDLLFPDKPDRDIVHHKLHPPARPSTPPPIPDDLINESAQLLYEGRHYKALEYLQATLAGYGNAENAAKRDAIGNIGLAYSEQGQYLEAIQYSQQAYDRFHEAGDKRGCAGALNNIAIAYERQGDFETALSYHARAQEEVSESEDDLVLGSLNNIGIVLRKQGLHSRALEQHGKALQGCAKIGDRIGCASSLNNIGVVMFSLQKYAAAMDCYARALQLFDYSPIYGDHPEMLATMHNMGLLFQAVGQLDDARRAYERALAGYVKLYGDNSPVTLGTLHNLGGVLLELGDFVATRELCARELRARQKVYGRKHHSVLAAEKRMGKVKALEGSG